MNETRAAVSALARRSLGTTGLDVSVLGFGAGSYWGMRGFSERQATTLVHEAIDYGVNLFDTGPSYSGGNAEPRLGRALAAVDRTSLVVSSKVGTALGSRGKLVKDFRPAEIRRQVEQSLRHLGIDRLSLLFLHGPSQEHLGAETQDCLADLKSRGLVEHLGLNCFDPSVIAVGLQASIFDCLMVDYNWLRIEREPLIEAWQGAGKGVLAAGAMARSVVGSRLLKVRTRADIWYLIRALVTRRSDIARGLRLRTVGRASGWDPSELALSFVLANQRVSSALVGTTRREHLSDNVSAAGKVLPPALLESIRQGSANLSM